MPVESANEAKLREHWQRVCNARLDVLECFLDAIPERYHERVETHLPAIIERIWVAAPAWAEKDQPAFVQWAVWRAALGTIPGHTFNPDLPNPIPTALLDLFLDHPEAEMNFCPHCRTQLPFTHQTGEYPNYIKPRCLADTCPVCRKDIPPKPY